MRKIFSQKKTCIFMRLKLHFCVVSVYTESSFKAQTLNKNCFRRLKIRKISKKGKRRKLFITIHKKNEREMLCTQKNNFVSIKLFYSFANFFFPLPFVSSPLHSRIFPSPAEEGKKRLKLMKRVCRKLKIVYFSVCA